MALTQDDVVNILKLIDQAPVGRFSLEVGDFKLDMVKGAGPMSLDPSPAGAVSVAAPVTAPASLSTPAAPGAAEPAPAATAAPGGTGPTIKAPLLGIFYRQPEPGAPPYVEVGSLVDEDTTVALIEVMKLFNPVRAGIRGYIRKICVDNGALVEYQQNLFEIDPA